MIAVLQCSPCRPPLSIFPASGPLFPLQANHYTSATARQRPRRLLKKDVPSRSADMKFSLRLDIYGLVFYNFYG